MVFSAYPAADSLFLLRHVDHAVTAFASFWSSL